MLSTAMKWYSWNFIIALRWCILVAFIFYSNNIKIPVKYVNYSSWKCHYICIFPLIFPIILFDTSEHKFLFLPLFKRMAKSNTTNGANEDKKSERNKKRGQNEINDFNRFSWRIWDKNTKSSDIVHLLPPMGVYVCVLC